jgi:Predicted Zn-dependent protease (DUF2268)
MAINFHVMAANGVLRGALGERLDAVLRETAEQCRALLCLRDIDVVVMNVPDVVIPRIGVNGTSYDAHQVVLWLDVSHEYLKANFAQTIRSVLGHELHHCARAHARGGQHPETYGEYLVLEGLACCFEEEIGGPTPFYAIECKGADLERFSERARVQLSATRKDLGPSWGDWMFGRDPNDPNFPYQCGYSLAYAVVRNWLTATGGMASRVVGVEAPTVLKSWLDRPSVAVQQPPNAATPASQAPASKLG